MAPASLYVVGICVNRIGIYLALAAERDCPFVTADERLLRKLDERRRPMLRVKAMLLAEGGALVLRAG
jgi:hypothetical protein